MVGSRRRSGGLTLLLLMFVLGVLFVADASGQADRALPADAERYQPGPIASRVEGPIASLPEGSQELFGLGVLLALLYGFRASGLAKSSASASQASRSE